MNAPHFDCLAQSITASGSRRGLLRPLAALPLCTPLLALLAPLSGRESEAANRRRQTRQRRDERGDRVQGAGKKKRKKKKKKCAQRCAGCCARTRCQAGTSSAACGRKGASCAACANPTPACVNNTCAPCTTSTQCASNSLCHEGACQACDVCASGCRYATVQAAVADPAGPATLRLCAGTYSEKVTIDRDVQLIGAGDGAGAENTILVGTGDDSVVTVTAGRTVTLHSMRITGGNTSGFGGGIQTDAALLTLAHCTVTGNHADFGGGIVNNFGGLVTLDHSDVTTNTAALGGGVYNNLGTITLRNGSSIIGNTATSPSPSGGGVYNDSTVNPSGGRITGNLPDQCVNAQFGTGCPP